MHFGTSFPYDYYCTKKEQECGISSNIYQWHTSPLRVSATRYRLGWFGLRGEKQSLSNLSFNFHCIFKCTHSHGDSSQLVVGNPLGKSILQSNSNMAQSCVPQPTKVSTTATIAKIKSFWSPKLIGSLNDAYEIKLAKLSGEFIWHSHPDTDEMFFVLSGDLTIKFREPGGNQELEDVCLTAGEMIVVPKGVRHCPVTRDGEEVSVMLFEPIGVVNTGDAETTEGLTNAVEDIRHGVLPSE